MAAKKAVKLFSTPFNKKIRRREQVILHKSENQIIDFEGLKVKTYIWGEGKKHALLVHGWAGNAGSMGAFVDPLMKAGYRVIAFDGPAHGRSEGRQTNIIQYARLLTKLLKQFDPEILIAHSFGSAASVYAIHHFKNTSLRKMVMLTTPDKFEDIIADFSNIMNLSHRNHKRICQYIEDRFDVVVDEMQVNKMVAALTPVELLIMHSKSDKVLAYNNSVSVTNNYQHAQLATLDKVGHYRMLWHHDVIDRAMKFALEGEFV